MSYLRNSAFSHTSPRFALEGVLRGFSSDTRVPNRRRSSRGCFMIPNRCSARA